MARAIAGFGDIPGTTNSSVSSLQSISPRREVLSMPRSKIDLLTRHPTRNQARARDLVAYRRSV